MHRFAPISVLTAVLVTFFALPAARSQTVEFYATAAPTYLNHLYTVTGSGSNAGSDFSGYWFIPPTAGVTLNFEKPGPVTLGLDFRGSPKLGTPGLGSFLVGLKLNVKTAPFHLKPYGQLSLGYLDQSHTTGAGASAVTSSQAYLGFELLSGVDYPVASHIDIRIVEVGLGVTRYSAATGTNTNPSPSIVSLQSGVVVHF